MKRTGIEKQLRQIAKAKGVILALTEGGAHTIVRFNDNFVTTIPRHKEISEMTARSILKDAANA